MIESPYNYGRRSIFVVINRRTCVHSRHRPRACENATVATRKAFARPCGVRFFVREGARGRMLRARQDGESSLTRCQVPFSRVAIRHRSFADHAGRVFELSGRRATRNNAPVFN